MHPNEDNMALLERAKKGDENAIEQLIVQNSPLIKSIVKRFLHGGEEFDDLFQIGSIGLLKAIRNFNTTFGVRFSTYAVPMIMGEIKRFLRDDGLIKVSRSIKTQRNQINKFIAEFEKENAKKPSLEKIAKQFEISEQEVIFALDSGKATISIFEGGENEKSQSMIEKIVSEDCRDTLFQKFVVSQAIAKLDERQKHIIYSRFFKDKTQSEIAKELGISQVQVSRIEIKTLCELKEKIGNV